MEGYRIRVDDKNLLTYWDSFIENEDVADKRLMKAALTHFRAFLKEEYPLFADRIEAKQLRPRLDAAFCQLFNRHPQRAGRDDLLQAF